MDNTKAILGRMMDVGTSHNFGFENLPSGLRSILRQFEYCVFVTEDFSISIMKSGSFYWILNSHERGMNGLYTSGGKAVLIRFKSIDDVCIHLRKLYNVQMDSMTLHLLKLCIKEMVQIVLLG